MIDDKPEVEVARYVIALPSCKPGEQQENVLPIVAIADEGSSAHHYKALWSGQGVPSGWPYEVTSAVCRRAVSAHHGSLLLPSGRCTPERYMDAWDDAIASPMSVQAFTARSGLTAVATYWFTPAQFEPLTFAHTDVPWAKGADLLAELFQERPVPGDVNRYTLVEVALTSDRSILLGMGLDLLTQCGRRQSAAWNNPLRRLVFRPTAQIDPAAFANDSREGVAV
jgi:hypothetical protein